MNINPNGKILVVAPHPDDESLGCGGFMMKYAKQVDSFCFLSSGISPDAKSKSDTRISEWNAAQEFIGCNNLGICELYGDKPLLPRIKDNMDYYLKTLDTSKYDYIFMPHFDDNHPEHQYVSNELMRNIIIQNGYKKDATVCFYEVWKPLPAPNDFVEIDPDKKQQLLSLYKTQWSVCNLPKKIIGLNYYRGVDCGFIDCAEAFFVMSVDEYLNQTKPIVEITENKDAVLADRIQVNFISNRFDLLYGKDYELYDLGNGVVPVHIDGNTAKLVLSLSAYTQKQLNKLYELLFAKHPSLTQIEIKHSLVPGGISEHNNMFYHYPYWHIDLPNTVEEFDSTLAHRVKYNTKWYPKKIREDIGDFVINKYTRKEVKSDVINLFFEWKKQSHNFDYKMTPEKYMDTYGVTEIYTLEISGNILAVGFTCTTGDNVFFEQFSYSQDKKYAKYSLGMVLYYGIICDLIKLGRKKFFLSGGWLDYKKRYNGILQYTYSGIINRGSTTKHKHHHSFWWHLKHLKF